MLDRRRLGVLAFLIIVVPIFAIPPVDRGGLIGRDILPMGGILSPRGGILEVRSVYGGRKKRYIIEQRAKKQCCREKICLSIMGEILDKDCKCKKCPTGVPALDGKSCQNDCPQGSCFDLHLQGLANLHVLGQEVNSEGGCCPKGQKPSPRGENCEADKSQGDETKRKGKCKGDTVLDPKHGPQDAAAENPVCAIDDQKDCKPPKVAATRPEGKENDATYKVKCGDPDPNKRAKCDPKIHYVDVYVTDDGIVTETCKRNRQYKEKKRNKVNDLKSKLKEKWKTDKPARDKKEQERKDNVKKLAQKNKEIQENIEKQQKIDKDNEKKRRQVGKCMPVTALMAGIDFVMKRKRDGEVNPYDMTTDYFDEDFIEKSNDVLNIWPSDLDIGQYGDVDVNAEAWMKHWEEIASAHDLTTK